MTCVSIYIYMYKCVLGVLTYAFEAYKKAWRNSIMQKRIRCHKNIYWRKKFVPNAIRFYCFRFYCLRQNHFRCSERLIAASALRLDFIFMYTSVTPGMKKSYINDVLCAHYTHIYIYLYIHT